jgi:Flp pilus assembly protein TadG
MRLIGHPERRRRRGRGQALVEFALVIPIFLTIVVAICEFSFLFTSYLSITYASRDAVQLAAELGNTPGVDCAVIQRITADVNTPANRQLIKTVEIYLVDTATGNSAPVGGAVATYTYDGGSHECTLPDGNTKILVPFSPTPPTTSGYPEASRCNVNAGTGCVPAKLTVDTIAVRITYQYKWITPFAAAAGGNGPLLVVTSVMRLEPVL